MLVRASLIAAFGLLSVACSDLDQFRTSTGASFRGVVVGSDGESFIRAGFPASTALRLTFDPSAVASSPGTLTTDDAACGEPTFSETPLLAIPPLTHDLLNQYDFPGAGRLRNYIFMARPAAGPLGGRDAMVFLSLLSDGSVESRIISGAEAGTTSVECDCAGRAAGRCAFFGVFPMRMADQP